MLPSEDSNFVRFAPMVGLSHYAVRQALSEQLPAGRRSLWPTEMLSSRRLPYQNLGQNPEVIFLDSANGLCPQLLGNEESFIRTSIEKLEDWGARAIDINMGCPVKKALQHNYGVALMGDADYAAKVTEMAVKSTRLPVSVKIRSGFTRDPEVLVRFARGLENSGAAWITLHPRIAAEKRRGEPDWTQIRLLKESLKIPVLANGDIECFEDIDRIHRATHCDRVVIGRALLAKPWLLRWQDPSSEEPSSQEQAEIYQSFLLRTLELSRAHYPESQVLRKFKFLVYHSQVWLEFGHELYRRTTACKTPQALEELLLTFFESPRKVFKRRTWAL